MTEEMQQKWIAGFWRRIGAFFIDTLILGLVGFLLGLGLENTFIQIGGWGRLVGFSVTLIYFGLMNSNLFNGQTLGKRLLRIRVVDKNNNSISLVKSVLRYIVLAAPFYLNGSRFTDDTLLLFLIYPISIIIFGGLFSIVYLYLFNRVTRQSLHDLAVGTFVVSSNAEAQKIGKVWRPHLAITASLFVAAATVPAFTGGMTQNDDYKKLLAVQSVLSDQKGVNYATVTASTATFRSIDEDAITTTYLAAHVFLSANKVSDAELAKKVAATIVQNYPAAENADAITVVLTYGFDIGIWSQWSSHVHEIDTGELVGDG